MANWVQVSKTGGGKAWVNLDLATFIGSAGSQYDYKTIIIFSGDAEPLTVEESVDQVASAAQRSNRA